MPELTAQQKYYQKNKNDPVFKQRKLDIMRAYYQRHKEERKRKVREYRKAHLKLVRTNERRYFKKKYANMSPETRTRALLRTVLYQALHRYTVAGKTRPADEYGIDYTAKNVIDFLLE